MKEKFTKGKWEIWGDWLICQNGTPENPIATFEPLGFNQIEGFANAHLIAAAPEMYEALKDIAELKPDDDCKINIEYVKELLAKARGESNE